MTNSELKSIVESGDVDNPELNRLVFEYIKKANREEEAVGDCDWVDPRYSKISKIVLLCGDLVVINLIAPGYPPLDDTVQIVIQSSYLCDEGGKF